MSTHTPGPWVYRRGDEWSLSVVTHHGELPDGNPNAWTVASLNTRRDEADANARLIAAAPDLLETLIFEYAELANIHNDWPGRNTQEGQAWLCKLRELIAKATGVSEREVQDTYAVTETR